MALKIEYYYQYKYPIRSLEKKIKRLLKVIPKEHLMGLEKITFVDNVNDKKLMGAAGIYKKNDGLKQASIEISMNVIFHNVPKIVFYFPFILDLYLAGILYHEIGHHYHDRYSHGVDKIKSELLAEKYRKTMSKKAFRIWRLILRPFSPIVRYLANKRTSTSTR